MRAANLPPLVIWHMEKAAPAIVDAVVKELHSYKYPTSEVFDQQPDNAAISATGELAPAVVVARPTAGSGHALVIATVTLTDCSLGEPTLGDIWELVDGAPTLEQLALEPTPWLAFDDARTGPICGD